MSYSEKSKRKLDYQFLRKLDRLVREWGLSKVVRGKKNGEDGVETINSAGTTYFGGNNMSARKFPLKRSSKGSLLLGEFLPKNNKPYLTGVTLKEPQKYDPNGHILAHSWERQI